MGKSIITEADRRATPPPQAAQGTTIRRQGGGQGLSRARGTATRSKKNPGKRTHQGG